MKKEIKVFANKEPKNSNIGYGSITIEDTIIITFNILNGKNGPFVSWPSYKKQDGTYYSYVMVAKENNYELVNEIIAEFNKVLALTSDKKEFPPKEEEKTSTKKTAIPKVEW